MKNSKTLFSYRLSYMDRFTQFLVMTTETRYRALALKSESTYESYVEAYARMMQSEFRIDPFPLTEEKIYRFLMFQRTQGRCYITAFSCFGGRMSWTMWWIQCHLTTLNMVSRESWRSLSILIKRRHLTTISSPSFRDAMTPGNERWQEILLLNYIVLLLFYEDQ